MGLDKLFHKLGFCSLGAQCKERVNFGGTITLCGAAEVYAKDGMELETIGIERNWGNCLARLNLNFNLSRDR